MSRYHWLVTSESSHPMMEHEATIHPLHTFSSSSIIASHHHTFSTTHHHHAFSRRLCFQTPCRSSCFGSLAHFPALSSFSLSWWLGASAETKCRCIGEWWLCRRCGTWTGTWAAAGLRRRSLRFTGTGTWSPNHSPFNPHIVGIITIHNIIFHKAGPSFIKACISEGKATFHCSSRSGDIFTIIAFRNK